MPDLWLSGVFCQTKQKITPHYCIWIDLATNLDICSIHLVININEKEKKISCGRDIKIICTGNLYWITTILQFWNKEDNFVIKILNLAWFEPATPCSNTTALFTVLHNSRPFPFHVHRIGIGIGIQPKILIRILIQKDLESGSKLFLNTIFKKFKLLHNYKTFSSKEVNWKIECCKSH